jgi:hypothetical protein
MNKVIRRNMRQITTCMYVNIPSYPAAVLDPAKFSGQIDVMLTGK